MDDSAPKRSSPTIKRKSVHWWSPDIDALRTQSNHLRRVYQRKKRCGIKCQDELEATKTAKLRLVTAIRCAKQLA